MRQGLGIEGRTLTAKADTLIGLAPLAPDGLDKADFAWINDLGFGLACKEGRNADVRQWGLDDHEVWTEFPFRDPPRQGSIIRVRHRSKAKH